MILACLGVGCPFMGGTAARSSSVMTPSPLASTLLNFLLSFALRLSPALHFRLQSIGVSPSPLEMAENSLTSFQIILKKPCYSLPSFASDTWDFVGRPEMFHSAVLMGRGACTVGPLTDSHVRHMFSCQTSKELPRPKAIFLASPNTEYRMCICCKCRAESDIGYHG